MSRKQGTIRCNKDIHYSNAWNHGQIFSFHFYFIRGTAHFSTYKKTANKRLNMQNSSIPFPKASTKQ